MGFAALHNRLALTDAIRNRKRTLRTRQIAFLVGAGCENLSLVAAAHPHSPDFGTGIDMDFILEHHDLNGAATRPRADAGHAAWPLAGDRVNQLWAAVGATHVVPDATSAVRFRRSPAAHRFSATTIQSRHSTLMNR